MDSNRSTVVLTITEYTTVYPTLLHTPSVSETFSTLSLSSLSSTSRNMLSSALQSKSLPSTFVTSVRPSSTPSSSFSTSVSPSNSFVSSIAEHLTSETTSSTGASSSVVSASNTSSSNSGLPSGWPIPAPQSTEKPHTDAVLLLFLVFLVSTSLLFLGSLIYFIWRFVRGHCPECSAKQKEIAALKQRLADQEKITPQMVRTNQVFDTIPENEEVFHTTGLNPIVPSDQLSKDSSQWIAYTEGTPSTQNTTSTGSANRMHSRSSGSVWHHTLSTAQNHRLALDMLVGNTRDSDGSNPKSEEFMHYRDPFWNRTLGSAGHTNFGRGEGVKRNRDEDWKGKSPENGGRIRTYSNPGPAPMPPTLPPLPVFPALPQLAYRCSSSVYSRPFAESPYSEGIIDSYFPGAGSGSSKGKGKRDSDSASSVVIPNRNTQRRSQSSGFITVRLSDDSSGDDRSEARLRAEDYWGKRA